MRCLSSSVSRDNSARVQRMVLWLWRVPSGVCQVGMSKGSLGSLAAVLMLTALVGCRDSRPTNADGTQDGNAETSGSETSGAEISRVETSGAQAAADQAARPAEPAVQPESSYTAENLSLAIEAVAAAEDADFGRAMGLWDKLYEAFPDDQSVAINQAATLLKWIDESNSQLGSGNVGDAVAREQLEAELAAAYAQADRVVGTLAALDGADYRAALLQAALLEAKSRQLQYPDDQALQRKAAELLAAALSSNPAQPLLASKFDELVQVVARRGDPLLKQNADALFASWQVEPNNLYLLSRAAETLLRNEDPRVAELLTPSLEVTRPMLSMVASSLQRLDPPTLVDEVKSAIAAEDWRGARGLFRWLNLFKGMSGFQPDARLVKPDIMALLDTTILNRMSDEVRKRADFTRPANQPSPRVPQYGAANQALNLSGQPVAATWFDHDLNLVFEIAAIDGNSLLLFTQNPQGQFETQPAQTLELSIAPTGLLVADLFEVDEPSRPRAPDQPVPKSVAELMLTLPASPEGTPESAPGETALLEDGDLDGSAVSGDRHDTLQELVLWGPEGVRIVTGKPANPTALGAATPVALEEMEAIAGLESLTDVSSAVAFDIEADGDLDLFLITASGPMVFQNNGNRTFTDVTQYSDFSQAPAGLVSLVACDYDADLDQDVLAISAEASSITLIENIRHGQLRARKLDDAAWPMLERPRSLAVAELDGNSSWDWTVATASGCVSLLTRTTSPGSVSALAIVEVDDAVDFQAARVVEADLNNDGIQDLVAAGPLGLQVNLRSVAAKLGEANTRVALSSAPVEFVEIVDANQDGVLDILTIEDGGLRVRMGTPADQSEFLSVRVRGINDVNGGGRNNHFAIGSVVEIWSGGRQQRRVIEHPVSHFGLGAEDVENVRIVFTNGLTQNVEKPSSSVLVEERQELKGSCPFVYGWNGERFELITDLLWNAPLGLQTARGEVLPDRRWENLLLPGELMREKDGAYELRVTEELWELAYFDHLQLTAIDHPANTRVFTNEKVGPPTLAEHQLFLVDEPIYAERATNGVGRDQTSAVTSADGNYAQTFDRLLLQGLAEPHFLELDFGDALAAAEQLSGELRLFLTGWMHPTDTSLNIGLSQNPALSLPEPPSLWVVDAAGNWICAQSFMGFPGGKPKSIVVDLQDVFVSDDRRIRIGSSQQIYWDEAFVAVSREFSAENLVEQPLEILSANLRYRGFSRLLERESFQPHWYDYTSVDALPKWPELEGPFTRFGDVLDLLGADDDRMVVMTSGDEIQLQFSAPPQPLPNGWRRDFVLHSVGWDKDADLNTLAGQGALPLPFAAQTAYPAEFDQADEAAGVLRLNAGTLLRLRQFRPEPAWEH